VIWLVTAAIVSLAGGAAAQERDSPRSPAALLARLGARVEQYFARAQNLVCDEEVHIHPMGYNSSGDGRARVLHYELRVAWEAASGDGRVPEATVLRRIQTINGRTPGPDEDPGCMDPQSISPAPLSVLLPGRRDEYDFLVEGTGREDGRRAVVIAFKLREPGAGTVTWNDDCVSVELPGRTSGRLWADAETDEVLRLDERVSGLFEFSPPEPRTFLGGSRNMALEGANTSTRFRRMRFEDPDEEMRLPASIETSSTWRGAGARRVVTMQQFSGCRRFITDARIVEPRSR